MLDLTPTPSLEFPLTIGFLKPLSLMKRRFFAGITLPNVGQCDTTILSTFASVLVSGLGATSGVEDTTSLKKPYVVMKARQVGSEIRSYDLRSSEDPATLDPSFLKVRNKKKILTLNRCLSSESRSELAESKKL